MNDETRVKPNTDLSLLGLYAALTRRLLWILPNSQRKGLGLVLIAAILAAITEMLGVASILPFMSLATGARDINQLGMYRFLLEPIGITKPEDGIMLIGFLTVVVLTVGNLSGAFNQYIQGHFVARTKRELSTELFCGYMTRPYLFHVQRDSASLTKVLFSDMESLVGGYLSAALTILAKGTLVIMLLGMLMWHAPVIALVMVTVLSGTYLALYQTVKKFQGRLGLVMTEANETRSRSAIEGLGGIKDLRVLGREQFFVDRFAEATKLLTSSQVASALIASIPRYAIEIVAYGGIVGLTLAYSRSGQETSLMPTLALYAFAAYRLMPALNQIYGSAATMHYNNYSVAYLEADLAIVRQPANLIETDDTRTALPFEKSIELRNVSFSHDGTDALVLNNVSLTLQANESVGLVGPTGAGKTTFVDLLLGLHTPSSGAILVDGTLITGKNERHWRRNVGYVPQHIYLMNASIAENIAIGVPKELIDMARVERAAHEAQADEFIARLPLGYHTVVGERGIRLSGGQRQRLGIARALYESPKVLFFDEATSALDGNTEDAVMAAIQNLSKNRTIVLVAHRLRTVQACDRIIMLNAGRIIADGTYQHLLATSPSFQDFSRGIGGVPIIDQPNAVHLEHREPSAH